MRRATADKTVEVLTDKWITKYGCPETIILDNGPQLRAKIFRQFAEKWNISLWYTADYHPQANPTEAVNHTIVKAIRVSVRGQPSHKNWDGALNMIACALNSSYHTAIQLTPYMAVFGENIALSGNDHRLRMIEDGEPDVTSSERFETIRSRITHALEEAYERRAQRYNIRARPHEYKVGDVYKQRFKLSDASRDYTAKLDHPYERVMIHDIVGSNCYRLIDTNGKVLNGTFSAKDLKPSTDGAEPSSEGSGPRATDNEDDDNHDAA